VKFEEQVAEKYLRHLGFADIVFEPEGVKKAPDFLVDNRIAVEVRRLNQNIEPPKTCTKLQGLEKDAFALQNRMKRLLLSLGPPTGPHCWYVHLRFRRPIPDWKSLEVVLRHRLQLYRDSSSLDSNVIEPCENVHLRLVPTRKHHSHAFHLSGSTDWDSGGWLMPELERNLKLCIEEKTIKVAAIRAKYLEWWLVFLDTISYGYAEGVKLPPHDGDKIILVNPIDHTCASELR